MTWRYQKSDEHYRGSERQYERTTEGSEVINRMHLLEYGIRYQVGPRWNVGASIPWLGANRSSPLRIDGEVVGRTTTETRGLSDVTVSAGRWMLDPASHPRSNCSLTLGLKLPTGHHGLRDDRKRVVNGEIVTVRETVDQSVQPGDGGVGLIAGVQAFRKSPKGRATYYVSASYLLNPRGTNGTPTFRSQPNEQVMSVADQYLLRTGVILTGASWRGVSLGLGARWEGVPVEDLLGPSDGFRRPGYSLALEPILTLSRGQSAFSIAVPYALYRNRTRSVPDREVEGRHGDAAFARSFVMLGWWRRF